MKIPKLYQSIQIKHLRPFLESPQLSEDNKPARPHKSNCQKSLQPHVPLTILTTAEFKSTAMQAKQQCVPRTHASQTRKEKRACRSRYGSRRLILNLGIRFIENDSPLPPKVLDRCEVKQSCHAYTLENNAINHE